jgi:hypothetical protein
VEINNIVFSDRIGQWVGRKLSGEVVIIPSQAVKDIQAAGEWIEQPDGSATVLDIENYGFVWSLGEVWEYAQTDLKK